MIFGALITFLLALFIYLIPSFMAFSRGIHARWGIFVLNLFFGWTVFGWVGALVWALVARKELPHPNLK